MALHFQTQGRFDNHTAYKLVQDPSHSGVMKMGNIVPRVGLKQRTQAFWGQ